MYYKMCKYPMKFVTNNEEIQENLNGRLKTTERNILSHVQNTLV